MLMMLLRVVLVVERAVADDLMVLAGLGTADAHDARCFALMLECGA